MLLRNWFPLVLRKQGTVVTVVRSRCVRVLVHLISSSRIFASLHRVLIKAVVLNCSISVNSKVSVKSNGSSGTGFLLLKVF